MKNLSDHSDDELLKLIAEDDEKAFKILFDRYWERTHTLAYSKLKSREITQEIVHDIFLTFWQRRHSLEIKNFSHYLHVSVKYRVITHINKQLSQRKYFEGYKDQTEFDVEETLRTVEYNELMKALNDGVKTLPEKTQKVFRLNRLEGHSVSEIARLLNLSEKAIEYHITRSLKELRLYLKEFLLLLCVGISFLFF